MMPNQRPGSLCLAFSNSRERKGLNYVRQVYNIANTNNGELDDNVAFLAIHMSLNTSNFFEEDQSRVLQLMSRPALTKTASCSQIT